MSPLHVAMRTRSGSMPRQVAALIFIFVMLIIVAPGVWLGVRANLAKGELEDSTLLAFEIENQISSGNGAASVETAVELKQHSASAAELTSDPLWRAFEVLPYVGPNLKAMRQLAAVVDGLAENAVIPLANVAKAINLSDFKPVDGAIDLQPLVSVQPQFSAADEAFTVAASQLARVDTSATLSAVRDATGKLSASVTDIAQRVGDVNRAMRLVPNMLGALGPRDYVLLFQNPAEVRATGGIAGAVALLHTENGKIALAQQATSADFPRFESSVLPLSDETRGLYGENTGQYIQDINFTPDFTQSASLAREMWKRTFGIEADGVISIDPVSLSYLLRATGPIALATGDTLTAETAVQLLLSEVYERYENPADQDAFFAAAAASVFSAVASGTPDPVALIEALAQAGREHRVMVWSAHEGDQKLLAGTTLSGGLPVSDNNATRFGVYLNDATGAKMGMYLDMQVALGQVTCRKDKRSNYGVTVTLSNIAPTDAASTLSDYVTGGGVYGVAPGSVKTIVVVYGAPGMQNLGITKDDSIVPYHPATDSSYPVSAITVELAPGESTVLHFGWLGLEPSSAPIVAQLTPVIHLNKTRELDLGCESALW